MSVRQKNAIDADALATGLKIESKAVSKPLVNRRASVTSTHKAGVSAKRGTHSRTKSHGVVGAATAVPSGRSTASSIKSARRRSVDLDFAPSSARTGNVSLNAQAVRAVTKGAALKRATTSAMSREEQLQKKLEKRAKEIAAEKEKDRNRKTELRIRLLQQRRETGAKTKKKQRELEEKQRKDMKERAHANAANEADRKKTIAEAERLRKMQIKQKRTETLNKRKTQRLTRAAEKKVAEAQCQREVELKEQRRQEKELEAKRRADVLRQKDILHEKQERERREREENDRRVYEDAMKKEQQLAEEKRRNDEERARIEAQHLQQQRANREAEQLIRVGKVTAVELADQKLLTTHLNIDQVTGDMPRAPGDDVDDYD